MRIASHAKINYVLDVLHRRSDGYHEIATIFLPLALHDDLHIEAREEGITLTCTHAQVPLDERNTAYKAALLLTEVVTRSERCTQCTQRAPRGVHVSITKRIPLAGGLGGSATNGAAVLKALNALWRLSLSEAQLAAIAARIGADAPFFLYNRPALATGIGERLTFITAPLLHIVVAEPRAAYPKEWHKTRELYALLDATHYKHLDIKAAVGALASGDLETIARCAGNVFETPAFSVAPHLRAVLQALIEAGAVYAGLCGAGPCLWALARSASHAARIGEAIERHPLVARTLVTHTLV